MNLAALLLLVLSQLPSGATPPALAVPHFPSPVHAFVWRNWPLVPAARMAEVTGATASDIERMGTSMGLAPQTAISEDQWRRSYITIIRRNWHLLPYPQILDLLDWTEEELAFTLQEDDFLYIKLGSLKPDCPPLAYLPPEDTTREAEARIAAVVREHLGDGAGASEEPLFGFVQQLSATPEKPESTSPPNRFSPRFCSSYFALYGDPLLFPEYDGYPEGYLARLAQTGVNGIWLQGILYKLAPFPWDPTLSADYETRLDNLRKLTARAGKHGIKVYLYLNEPRSMLLPFFEGREALKGVVEGDRAAMCTSSPEVQAYLRDAVSCICKAVPDLGGFFTITASENLSNCWSHGNGPGCARCGARLPETVIAEVNGIFQEGIENAASSAELIAWDWGWRDDWAVAAIDLLPQSVALQSVSEWSIPISRGGIPTVVGEYSISTVGPGPRATKHWAAAHARGLRTIAKIQAGNTWELSAVPYIPAVGNVAQHGANLRESGVNGLMLGWTLGGYPSPNLEVIAIMGSAETDLSVEEALRQVAGRRFGSAAAPAVAEAWQRFSTAFSEFPYSGGTVYQAPLQMGPANLLWAAPTGYKATMVGIPYDDLDGWRSVYPADVFIGQFEKIVAGFESGLGLLNETLDRAELTARERNALASERDVAEAALIHFRSVAAQSRFVRARNQFHNAENGDTRQQALAGLEQAITEELENATRLHAIQSRDSRIGFEASNQYFYVPIDLAEKVINCAYLRDTWLKTL